jgi:hypothetical protein
MATKNTSNSVKSKFAYPSPIRSGIAAGMVAASVGSAYIMAIILEGNRGIITVGGEVLFMPALGLIAGLVVGFWHWIKLQCWTICQGGAWIVRDIGRGVFVAERSDKDD